MSPPGDGRAEFLERPPHRQPQSEYHLLIHRLASASLRIGVEPLDDLFEDRLQVGDGPGLIDPGEQIAALQDPLRLLHPDAHLVPEGLYFVRVHSLSRSMRTLFPMLVRGLDATPAQRRAGSRMPAGASPRGSAFTAAAHQHEEAVVATSWFEGQVA